MATGTAEYSRTRSIQINGCRFLLFGSIFPLLGACGPWLEGGLRRGFWKLSVSLVECGCCPDHLQALEFLSPVPSGAQRRLASLEAGGGAAQRYSPDHNSDSDGSDDQVGVANIKNSV